MFIKPNKVPQIGKHHKISDLLRIGVLLKYVTELRLESLKCTSENINSDLVWISRIEVNMYKTVLNHNKCHN